MKKVITSLFFIGITISGFSQKIGFFNSGEVLKDYAPIKKIDSTIKDYVKTLDKAYEYLKDEYNTKRKKLQDSAKLDKETISFLKEDLNSLGQRLNDFENEETQKITIKKNELSAPLIKTITDIVTEIAKEKKYDFIFDTSSTPIFYSTKENDISSLIIKRLPK